MLFRSNWNFDTLSSIGRFFKIIHLFMYRENTLGSNDLGEVHIIQKEHVNTEGEEVLSIGVRKAVFLLSPLKYVDNNIRREKKNQWRKWGGLWSTMI